MNYLITQIRPGKHKKGRYNLYTEDGFLLSLSDEIIVSHSIKEGTELSEELLHMLKEADTFRYAKDLAFSYVTYAPRSKSQLRKHLLEKDIDETIAQKTIALMEEYRYINDDNFAQQYAASYLKKYSPYVVLMRLKQAGVSEQTAKSAIEAAHNAQYIRDIFENISKKYASLEPQKRRGKIAQAMARRGFSWPEIAACMEDPDEF